MGKTVLYAKTSSSEQTIDHQRLMAEQAGFEIDDIIEDIGMLGVQIPLREREGGKRLFDLLSDGDILVVRWIDHLGRNYAGIQANIRLFLDRGVTIKTVINDMKFDSGPTDAMTKAVRDAMLSFLSSMAEAQEIAHKEAQKAGIAHARETKTELYKGRKPTYTFEDVSRIQALLSEGMGINQIAREIGLNKFAVSRISRDIGGAFAKLSKWELRSAP